MEEEEGRGKRSELRIMGGFCIIITTLCLWHWHYSRDSLTYTHS